MTLEQHIEQVKYTLEHAYQCALNQPLVQFSSAWFESPTDIPTIDWHLIQYQLLSLTPYYQAQPVHLIHLQYLIYQCTTKNSDDLLEMYAQLCALVDDQTVTDMITENHKKFDPRMDYEPYYQQYQQFLIDCFEHRVQAHHLTQAWQNLVYCLPLEGISIVQVYWLSCLKVSDLANEYAQLIEIEQQLAKSIYNSV